ncbi:hypothetical protein [Paenibacillus sp. NPDC057967]|uniref:hypothetical protein n=1 Tax=Paenibacillus sp. NPDC057967 TaxID=3346293 RepID=UPI0036DD621B
MINAMFEVMPLIVHNRDEKVNMAEKNRLMPAANLFSRFIHQSSYPLNDLFAKRYIDKTNQCGVHTFPHTESGIW